MILCKACGKEIISSVLATRRRFGSLKGDGFHYHDNCWKKQKRFRQSDVFFGKRSKLP